MFWSLSWDWPSHAVENWRRKMEWQSQPAWTKKEDMMLTLYSCWLFCTILILPNGKGFGACLGADYLMLHNPEEGYLLEWQSEAVGHRRRIWCWHWCVVDCFVLWNLVNWGIFWCCFFCLLWGLLSHAVWPLRRISVGVTIWSHSTWKEDMMQTLSSCWLLCTTLSSNEKCFQAFCEAYYLMLYYSEEVYLLG